MISKEEKKNTLLLPNYTTTSRELSFQSDSSLRLTKPQSSDSLKLCKNWGLDFSKFLFKKHDFCARFSGWVYEQNFLVGFSDWELGWNFEPNIETGYSVKCKKSTIYYWSLVFWILIDQNLLVIDMIYQHNE